MIISKISDIYNKYSKVLRDTQRYINNIRDKQSQILVDNINEFKKFIIDYSKILNSSVFYIKNIINFIKSFFSSGMQHIPLIAIDGSSGKEKLEDCIIFYSLAYGISGEILIQHDSVKFSYPTSPLQPSDPNSLNSIVAYVPVPYSEILSENESFDDVSYIVLSDYEKFDMSILNLELMKLAEIYLSYKSTNNYKIILIDYLLSSLLMHSEIHWENIGLINGEFRGITGLSITPAHIAITKAHPFYLESDYLINQFKVPACTKFRLFSRLIADVIT